jgi:hypothetical protein
MGASFRYVSADGLGMSCLPLPRSELDVSREQCVLPCLVESEGRRCRTQYPLRAGTEDRGISVRPRGWAHRSGMRVQIYSLDMYWLPLPRFDSRAAGVRVLQCMVYG